MKYGSHVERVMRVYTRNSAPISAERTDVTLSTVLFLSHTSCLMRMNSSCVKPAFKNASFSFTLFIIILYLRFFIHLIESGIHSETASFIISGMPTDVSSSAIDSPCGPCGQM